MKDTTIIALAPFLLVLAIGLITAIVILSPIIFIGFLIWSVKKQERIDSPHYPLEEKKSLLAKWREMEKKGA